MKPAFDLTVLSYPYHASKHTGRGHDRYVAELVTNISEHCPELGLRVIDYGFSKSAREGGLKLPKLVGDLAVARADVYHAISPVGGATATLLGKTPLVVTIHDVIPFNVRDDYDNPLKYRIWRQCIRLCVKKSAALIVPYQVTKNELVTRLKADPNKVHVVNYGVDHAVYFHRPSLERAARRILYVGEVSRSKGVEVLLRAFQRIKRAVPDAELVVAGKRSKDQAMLEALARELELADLTFMGFIPEKELADYYGTATVMVFPSHCGFGLSTLEAMACGTPVVGVAALDAPEFFADAGVLAEPDDAADLAECLTRVLTGPDLQGELSRKSLARAALFSWSRTARETVSVYARVAGARGGSLPLPDAAQ